MFDILRRSRKKWKCFIAIVFVAGFINEWLVYHLVKFVHWPEISSSFPMGSIKLLLVGDPQLLGEKLTSGPFSSIARFDSDRYVAKTFNLAHSYVDPDITIFLGDVLDEGETANDDEFARYFERFKSVFHPVNFNKAIILPGDNDIGGEVEPPSIDNEKRFDKHFKNDNFISYRFLEFVKVNYLTQSNDFVAVPNISENVFRVLLSHVPLSSMFSSFTKKVFEHLQPNLVLSAHDHISVHLVVNSSSGEILHSEAPFLTKGVHIGNLTKSFTQEIMVPTCSYRMGTMNMGYGALFISANGEFVYTVLWLPSRFHQLLAYCGVLILLLLLILPFS